MSYVCVGVPSYNELMPVWALPPLMQLARKHTMHFMPVSSSLLAFSHNLLISSARQIEKCDYLINMHNDIVMDPDGLLDLVELCQLLKADVVSAVVPIKDDRGLTSTGTCGAADEWEQVKRFTMTEIMAMPETFGQEVCKEGDILMINTGVMIIDMKAPWVKDICFTIKDRIIEVEGRPHPIVLPEDWGLSRDLYKWGAKVYATRKLKLTHLGRMAYPNSQAWGTVTTDQGDQRKLEIVNHDGGKEAVAAPAS